MTQVMTNKIQTTQHYNRVLEDHLHESKLNRTAWRMAGVLIGLFFAKTSLVGMQHPLNPLTLPVLFDAVHDWNRLKKIQLEQKNIEVLKSNPQIFKNEAELLCMENQQYEEMKSYTQTAMKVKAAFFMFGLMPAVSLFIFPSQSDPLFGLKQTMATGLEALGIVGMLASSVYGLFHCYLSVPEEKTQASVYE